VEVNRAINRALSDASEYDRNHCNGEKRRRSGKTNSRFFAVPPDAVLKTLCPSKTDLVAGDRSLVSILNFLQDRFQVFGDRLLALACALNPKDVQQHRVGKSALQAERLS